MRESKTSQELYSLTGRQNIIFQPFNVGIWDSSYRKLRHILTNFTTSSYANFEDSTTLLASKRPSYIGRPHAANVDKDRLNAPVEARSNGECLQPQLVRLRQRKSVAQPGNRIRTYLPVKTNNKGKLPPGSITIANQDHDLPWMSTPVVHPGKGNHHLITTT